jgi:glycosyltransferase involved in cell wall biosynthesis
VRGCRQVVDHEITGLLVPLRDPDALAKAIHSLGEDPATRAAYGAAGATKACREFDERRVVQTVLDAYRSIADGKGLDRVADALRATIPDRRAAPNTNISSTTGSPDNRSSGGNQA